MNHLKGKIIVLEGAEEVAKTSVGNLLAEKIEAAGQPTVFTFQPGDLNYSPLAPMMRSLCKDKRWELHELSQLYAFLLDRSEQCAKVILPALEEGKTVISDRWSYSTYAYQLHGKQLKEKYNFPDEICDILGEESILGRKPDKVLYFTKKVGNRKNDENDCFDHASDEFFKRVNAAYDFLAERDNWFNVIPLASAEATAQALFRLFEKPDCFDKK